jgi:hypothetical protein
VNLGGETAVCSSGTYAENRFGNATERVDIKLNYHYR